MTKNIITAIHMKKNKIIQEETTKKAEFPLVELIRNLSSIASPMFTIKKWGRNLFDKRSSKTLIVISDSYRSETFETISILNGIRKAITAASNAAISERKSGLG